jgi:hypothetical protein
MSKKSKKFKIEKKAVKNAAKKAGKKAAKNAKVDRSDASTKIFVVFDVTEIGTKDASNGPKQLSRLRTAD